MPRNESPGTDIETNQLILPFLPSRLQLFYPFLLPALVGEHDLLHST